MKRCRIDSLAVVAPMPLRRKSAVELAVRAARKCLFQSRYRREQISLLINCGVNRDGFQYEPSAASQIQFALRINRRFAGARTFSFDLMDGEIGVLRAVQTVQSMMYTQTLSRALIVAAEVDPSRDGSPAQRRLAIGAAALLDIAPRPDNGFGPICFRRCPPSENLERVIDLSVPGGRVLSRGDASALGSVLAPCALEIVQETLDASALGSKDIDLFLLPSGAGALAALFATKLCISPEKIFVAGGERGLNYFGVGLLAAVYEAKAQGRIEPGSKVLIVAHALGPQVAAALYFT